MENKIFQIIKNNIHKIEHLSGYEKSVFDKILNCRTEPVPFLFTQCDTCKTIHPVYKSCKDRMCPICNGSASIKWAAKREAELLPTSYFMLTYTIPAELRPLFLANKKTCYNLLFKAVNRSLSESIQNNNRKFHGKAGFFAILHTWDQKLNYHPHLHVVVPAGCLNNEQTKWIHSNPTYLLPVKKISIDFKKKLILYLRKEDRSNSLQIPKKIKSLQILLAKLENISWVINSQPPKKGKPKPELMLRYLSRYVSKTAVDNRRIKKLENSNVHLHYYDRKQKIKKIEVLTEIMFMKRLILHILPKGFKKVRFYGFMANRHRAKNLILCRMLLGQPLAEQEEINKDLLNDTAFLYWKYFKVDISLCSDCGKGHIHFTHGYAPSG